MLQNLTQIGFQQIQIKNLIPTTLNLVIILNLIIILNLVTIAHRVITTQVPADLAIILLAHQEVVTRAHQVEEKVAEINILTFKKNE